MLRGFPFWSRTASAAMVVAGCIVSTAAFAQVKDPAFRIAGKTTSMEEVAKSDQSAFYEIERKKYELIERLARERYLEHFWAQRAKETNTSVEAARQAYMTKNVSVSNKEVNETLDKFKDHPQLKKLAKAEQEKQVRDYLRDKSEREVLDNVVDSALKKGDLVITFPKPEEPVYQVNVTEVDHVRYGPSPKDTKPAGCSNDCAITIVEYSEFQCPFCERVMPDVKRVLTEYKGKVRWITRDFPLSFHDRARPAAVAAHCAGDQGKFWDMYTTLFENQNALGDADFEKYAQKIEVDMAKWQECVKSPGPKNELIDRHFQSGVKLGVSGTPAFFINGRRLSGALPFSEFKRVIDEELKRGRRS